MAQQQTFASVLDKPSSEVERPKPVPVGSYLCVIKGLPRHDVSSKKKTPFVEFTAQPIQVGEDVDQEALEEMGGFANKTFKLTYYATEDALWRLKEFLDHCGIEDEGTIRQRTEQAPGKQVWVIMKHEASEDGQSVFARPDKTMAV